MKIVLQRVQYAKVFIDNDLYREIQNGYLILLGFSNFDDNDKFEYFIKKILNLKLFSSNNKDFALSLLDKNYELLVVSQFTLYGNVNKGNSVSWDKAMKFEKAKKLYNIFIAKLIDSYQENKIKTGIFGADMQVELKNDGPVTIIIEK